MGLFGRSSVDVLGELRPEVDEPALIWPRSARVLDGSGGAPEGCTRVCCVDTEEIESFSESRPPVIDDSSPVDVVESDLFFLGMDGSTLPGSSSLMVLCNRLKSP